MKISLNRSRNHGSYFPCRHASAHFLAVLIAACAMVGRLSAGPVGLAVPASEWGPGSLSILLDMNAPATGTFTFTSGFGSPITGSNASITGTSNVGVTDGGSSTGTASAYTDVNGIHVYASVASSGYESSTAEAMGAFTDTVTNNSGVAASFQIGFNVDGQLSDNGGAYSALFIDVWDGYAYSTIQDHVEGVQNFLWSQTGSNPTAVKPIDQNYLTNSIELAPGASYTYTLSMDAYAATSQNGVSLDAPDAVTDASDTLSITSFSAVDGNGNPLPASDFSSAEGVNYGSIDDAEAPEPATFGLCGSLAILLLLYARRQSSGRPA